MRLIGGVFLALHPLQAMHLVTEKVAMMRTDSDMPFGL